MSTPNTSVLWSVSQSLTESQKAQARANIGAAPDSIAQFTPIVADVTTYAEFESLYNDASVNHKNMVLVNSDGALIGKFKYFQNSMAIFETFFVQPTRFVEMVLSSSNGWETRIYYPFDTSVPRVYRRTNTGSNYQQMTLPAMSVNLNSYMASQQFTYNGSAISGTIWDEFTSEQPQLVRYDYSGAIAHVLDGEPAGSPVVIGKINMILEYQLTANDSFVALEIGGSPLTTVDFQNYTQNTVQTQYYESDWVNLNFSFTFDQRRYASFYDCNAFLMYPKIEFSVLGGGSLPGTAHDLKQISSTEQWTFINHI